MRGRLRRPKQSQIPKEQSMSKVGIVTDKNFKEEILESRIPVLVDFWASWCPPCKMTEPTVHELSLELNGAVKVVKINVDQNPISASQYEIAGVPTFIIFENGKEISRCIGAQSKQQLLSIIREADNEVIALRDKG